MSWKLVGARAMPRPASTSVIIELTLSHATAMRGLEEIEAKTRGVADKRRGALPSEPNAGSVFRANN